MALEAAQAARARAAQANDFFHDLERWEDEICAKDNELKLKKALVSKTLPPVRSQQAEKAATVPSDASSVAKATPGSTSSVEREKEKRIKSSDYRSWDKYNVEEELRRLEQEEKVVERQQQAEKKQRLTDEVDQDDVEPAPMMSDIELRKHMAQIEKDKGNAQFKGHKYAAAVECYTRGLEVDPDNVPLLANRAMANLKLKKYDLVIEDSTAVLTQDPTHEKVLQRRATAYEAIEEYASAIADWEQFQRKNPKAKLARTKLESLKQLLKAKTEREHKTFNPLTTALEMKKKQEQRKKPMLRIPIEDV
eukprot:m.7625 g.7625  ORF g.7625 m.7625 type:complete len:307 (+) comp5266_c0_seq1:89-1009(+)